LRRRRASAVPHARVTHHEPDRREFVKRMLAVWREELSALEITFQDSERFGIVNRLV